MLLSRTHWFQASRRYMSPVFLSCIGMLRAAIGVADRNADLSPCDLVFLDGPFFEINPGILGSAVGLATQSD